MPGGKSGFVLGKRPKHYHILPQQEKMQKASEFCGIRKGISRAELVDKMKNCLPKYFADEKGKPVPPTEGENHA